MSKNTVLRTYRPGEQQQMSESELHELDSALVRARGRLGTIDTPNQVLGKRLSIGCVALEITQRCNLDCSLCYLSQHSQFVRDLPLEALLARLDDIKREYGVGTNVQITGGDPTLRKHHELVEIVRHTRDLGLIPALFTNGIAASQKLLHTLVDHGLSDVAFHVDLTQKHPGYDTEAALNVLRRRLIERVRGLPLMVVFNTTVHKRNFHEIPELARFFVNHADVVGMASFQLQADTGRGELRKRAVEISLETVRAQIERGAGAALGWDRARVGHPACHSYVPTLVVNGAVHDVIDDETLFSQFLLDFQGLQVDRRSTLRNIAWQHLKAAHRQPIWYWHALRYATTKLWQMKSDLIAARGRAHKLSFFVQNFMDAEHLDPERIRACSFMVMTSSGAMSMCEHNSRRDEFILQPIPIRRSDGIEVLFEPIKRPRSRKNENAPGEQKARR